MEFKNWLFIEERKIAFTMFSSDGKVRVVIGDENNGYKKYQFETDPLYINRVKEISRYKPFSALNILKDLVKNDKATYKIVK